MYVILKRYDVNDLLPSAAESFSLCELVYWCYDLVCVIRLNLD